MRDYETVVIVKPTLETEAVDSAVSKVADLVKANKGRITKIDKWGRKKLAYAIEGHTDGFYAIITFKGGEATLAELDRAGKLMDEVIRLRTVRISKN
ncbi:MAG: 30S ribosomal protein S6 [Terriglobia bacterium]